MRRRAIAVAAVCVLAVGVVGVGETAEARTEVEGIALDLLALVPAEHRYTCEIADLGDYGAVLVDAGDSIAVVVRCAPGYVDFGVAYVRFTDYDAMDSVYRRYVGNAANEPVRSEDGECPGESTWSVDDVTVGSVGCFYYDRDHAGEGIPERVALVWTYDDELILGVANAPAADAVSLTAWWAEEAGPLQAPEDIEGVVITPGSASSRSVRALRAHVPKGFRASCRLLDGDETAGGLFEQRRLFVSTPLRCSPRRGADFAWYSKVDPTILDAFFAPFTVTDEDAGDPCPNHGTWSLGSGKRKREVGEYSCYSKDGTAFVLWTQRELGIFAYASRDDGDFDALYEFWDTEAGPV